MFASGNLGCPNFPGSCKNSMVGDILHGRKVLHPVAKNKMSLR